MRGERARLLLLAAALSAAAGGAAAQGIADAGRGAAAADESALEPPGDPAPLQLVVNGVPQDVVTVRLAPDGDVWMPLAPLGAAGLRGLGGARRQVEGWAWVSLRSLGPGVAFTLDEASLELRVDAVAGFLGRSALDVGGTGRPAGLETRGSPSAFANYALQASDDRDLAAFAELGVGAGSWLAASGISRTPRGEVLRGLSAVTREEPARLRRLVAGDAVASAGPLGGTLVLGGLGVERDFALDPWFVRQPLPRATAVALTPSTVEVYVNGRLVRQERVAPGTIELGNLPVEAGAGTVRTVVRDAYGRTQEIDSQYYLSTSLLAPGLTDYGWWAGLRREGVGSQGGEYGDLLAVGRHRFGWSDAVTIGGRLEAGPSLASGGPTLTAALPLGQLELSLAASAASRRAGGAAAAAWSWLARGASAGLRASALSASYAHGSLAAAQDRPLAQGGAFVSFALPWSATLGLDLSAQRTRDRGDGATAALRASVGLGRGTSLLASTGWTRLPGARAGIEASLLLVHALGGGTTASASADRTPDRVARATAAVERNLPVGSGTGYRLEAGAGETEDLSGALQAQGRVGRVEIAYQRRDGEESALASVAGGVVAIGGDAFLTRPVQEGYALVQVPGVPGVRAYLNEQEVGRTDGRGNLLVPGLLPHHANKLSIRGADVPMDFSIEAVERLVAPPRRVGAKVLFDVRRITTLTGTLSVVEPAGAVTPAWGELRVAAAGVESSPISSDGRFYLANVPPGPHAATIDYAGGTCRFSIEVPSAAEALVDVGALRCLAAATAGAPDGPPSASTVTHTSPPVGGAGN